MFVIQARQRWRAFGVNRWESRIQAGDGSAQGRVWLDCALELVLSEHGEMSMVQPRRGEIEFSPGRKPWVTGKANESRQGRHTSDTQSEVLYRVNALLRNSLGRTPAWPAQKPPTHHTVPLTTEVVRCLPRTGDLPCPFQWQNHSIEIDRCQRAASREGESLAKFLRSSISSLGWRNSGPLRSSDVQLGAALPEQGSRLFLFAPLFFSVLSSFCFCKFRLAQAA